VEENWTPTQDLTLHLKGLRWESTYLLINKLVTLYLKKKLKHESLLIVALELRRLVSASRLALVGAVIKIIPSWLRLIERMRAR
jgi:hypothetical protein